MVETEAAAHPHTSFVGFFSYSGSTLQWQSRSGKRLLVAIRFTLYQIVSQIYLLDVVEYE